MKIERWIDDRPLLNQRSPGNLELDIPATR